MSKIIEGLLFNFAVRADKKTIKFIKKLAKQFTQEIESEILNGCRNALCQYCRDGSPPGKVLDGTKINGMYAHRIHDHNYVCEADLLLRRMEADD